MCSNILLLVFSVYLYISPNSIKIGVYFSKIKNHLCMSPFHDSCHHGTNIKKPGLVGRVFRCLFHSHIDSPSKQDATAANHNIRQRNTQSTNDIFAIKLRNNTVYRADFNVHCVTISLEFNVMVLELHDYPVNANINSLLLNKNNIYKELSGFLVIYANW